jgi:molecular chaperone GrpE
MGKKDKDISEELEEQLEEVLEASDDLEEGVISPQIQIADLQEQVLRAQAEVQNVRRIAAQEVTKARLYGAESLAREFLAVGDNLERALESCLEGSEVDLISEGLELTLKSFESSLLTAGITSINPIEETFNPEEHEALSLVEDDSKEDNIIINVIQRGFKIQGRILRPAKVIVCKKSKKN